MARPIKTGLDYFPLDVNIFDDDKLFDVQQEFGPLGEIIYLRLLCLIYKNGYYYKFDNLDKLSLRLIKSIGSKWVRDKNTVKQVIPFLAKSNLFSTELMQENVLTSESIQRRYLKATERRQQNIERYWLLETSSGLLKEPNNLINVDNNLINVDSNLINVDNSTQSKAKESKVNKSKVKQSKEQKTEENSDLISEIENRLIIEPDKGFRTQINNFIASGITEDTIRQALEVTVSRSDIRNKTGYLITTIKTLYNRGQTVKPSSQNADSTALEPWEQEWLEQFKHQKVVEV